MGENRSVVETLTMSWGEPSQALGSRKIGYPLISLTLHRYRSTLRQRLKLTKILPAEKSPRREIHSLLVGGKLQPIVRED